MPKEKRLTIKQVSERQTQQEVSLYRHIMFVVFVFTVVVTLVAVRVARVRHVMYLAIPYPQGEAPREVATKP